jgi:hypothetical protein
MEPVCLVCPTQQQAEWHALDRDGIRLLNSTKSCSVYKAGQVIFQQNN